MSILKVYGRDPFNSLGDNISLTGKCDEKDARALKNYLDRLVRNGRDGGVSWHSPDRHMINIWIDDPGEDVRLDAFKKVEALLNTISEAIGWNWRISTREDPLDAAVIDSESNDHFNSMHDLGAKGRRAYNENTRGQYSCYFTGTPKET